MAGYIYRGGRPFIPHTPAPDEEPRPKLVRKPRALKEFDPTKCGTIAGYRQHRTRGLKLCRACLDAGNAYQQAYRERRRSGR